MADKRELKIQVTADTAQADASLKKLEQQGDNLTTHVSTGQKLSNTYTELHSKVSLLRDAWHTLTGIIEPFIKASQESEAATRDLTAAMKDQGTYSEEAIKLTNDWARATSAKLGIDDEALINIQAMLASLSKLSGEELNKATQATISYAEITGKSYDSAARIITSFVTGATPKIRGLKLDVDKTADAHVRINALVDATSAGYARLEERAGTFEGAQARVGVAWENVIEVLGRFITESPIVIEIFNSLASGLQSLAETMEDHPERIEDFIESIKSMTEAVQDAITFIGDIGETLERLLSPIDMVKRAFTELGEWIKETFGQIVEGAQAMYDELVGHSIIPDMNQMIINSFREMGKDIKDITAKDFADILNTVASAYRAMGYEDVYTPSRVLKGFLAGESHAQSLAAATLTVEEQARNAVQSALLALSTGKGGYDGYPVSGSSAEDGPPKGHTPANPLFVKIVDTHRSLEVA